MSHFIIAVLIENKYNLEGIKEFMQITSNEDLFKVVDCFVNAWCDRRCLKALRLVLQGWPLVSGLTDDWINLYDALRQVRALAKDELTKEEIADLDTAINAVGKVVFP